MRQRNRFWFTEGSAVLCSHDYYIMGLNMFYAIWPAQPKQNTSVMFRLVLKHLVLVKKYFKSNQAFPVCVCLFQEAMAKMGKIGRVVQPNHEHKR